MRLVSFSNATLKMARTFIAVVILFITMISAGCGTYGHVSPGGKDGHIILPPTEDPKASRSK